MLRLVIQMRVVKQRLRRDTTNVQASATQRTTLFDTCDLKAQLGSLDGSDVSARASANNDKIEFIYSINRRLNLRGNSGVIT